MIADTLVIIPKKKTMQFHAAKDSGSDNTFTIKIASIHQPETGNIMIAGTNKLGTRLIAVQSHGTMECNGMECTHVKNDNFIPSLESIKNIDTASDVVGSIISMYDGFIDKNSPGTKVISPRSIALNNVSNISFKDGKKKFVALVNDKSHDVDSFFISPSIVKSVAVNPDQSIDIITSNASCIIGKDNMRLPTRTSLYCDGTINRDTSYKKKSYLSIYKEQLQNARSTRFGDSITRHMFPECHINGGKVCCHDSDDDDELCY